MPEALQTLGRYQLLDRLSIGGMAEIFRAKAVGDEGFEKLVAVKCILPHMADDAEFVDMFIDEARTVAQLNHANICQIFEFGQDEGVYFIAIEMVEGKDLKRVADYHRQRNLLMPLPMSLYIMRRTCSALDYAHNCVNSEGELMNIVHRDISPQNILVSYAGDVKLIDFGIAKAVGRLTNTVSGSIKGKFSYMSPEQVSGKPIDLRSDIFACGTVLWELLTGVRLFKGPTEVATMQMVRRAEVDPPSMINPEVPPELDKIMARALARDPLVRYQTAGELLDDLDQLALEQGLSCSTNKLAKWMDELFGEERAETAKRVRELEQRLPAADAPSAPEADNAEESAASPPPAPQPVAQPVAPGQPPTLSPTPSVTGRLPGVGSVTGTGLGTATGTGTFTETEYVYVSSKKPWLLVGILSLVLITGAALVILLWPRSKPSQLASASPDGGAHDAAPALAAKPDATKLAATPSPDAAPARPQPEAAPTPPKAKRPTPKRPRPKVVRPHPRPRPIRVVTPKPDPVTPKPKVVTPTPTPQLGKLLVASKPWARVWVDGMDTGRNTPIHGGSPLRLKPGRHTVSLQVGSKRFDYIVSIKAGGTTKLVKTLNVSH